MHILYLDWPCFGQDEMLRTFQYLGHTYSAFSHPDYKERISDDFLKEAEAFAKSEDFDFCFSYNFFPLMAEVCHKLNLKYISLTYDSPFVKLYSYRISYPTNVVFHFDSFEVDTFRKGGLKNIHYMPLPVNSELITELLTLPYDKEKTDCEISFVGALYDEDHNIYDRMYQKVSPFTQGFLSGLLDAQRKISGYNFIQDSLTTGILQDMQQVEPYEPYPDGAETLDYVYAEYYLNRKLTSLERRDILEKVAGKYEVSLFTLDPKSQIPGVVNKGPASYYSEMPLIFHNSAINLNISLRSIKSGIPLRCMDIFGAGGFLLTNYQADLFRHFEADRDFVFFEDDNDLMRKIEYYLNHEDERKTIAENGHKKAMQNHSFLSCVEAMLNIAFS